MAAVSGVSETSVRGNLGCWGGEGVHVRASGRGCVQSRKAVVWAWPRPHSPEDPAGGGKGTPSTQQLGLLGALTRLHGAWSVSGVVSLQCPPDLGAVAPVTRSPDPSAVTQGQPLQTRALSP